MTAKLGFEQSKNNLIQLQTRQAVLNYEADNMRSRLQSLYEAIGSLGDAKLIMDKHNAQLQFINEKNVRLERELKELQMHNSRAIEENREKDVIIKDIQKRVNKVKEEKERYGAIFREKMLALDREQNDAVMIRKQSLVEQNKL